MAELTASLAMYDWPQIQWANDALWRAVRDRLRASGHAAPNALDRSRELTEIWRDKNLLLAQTCGYPYVTNLKGRVQLVATPCYGVDGCEGPNYSSHLIVRRDRARKSVSDLRACRVAINSLASQSGYSALRSVIAPMAEGGRFFSQVLITGGHLASLEAVAAGRADTCATDAICWQLAKDHRPELAECLCSIAKTPSAPGLPLITSNRTDERTLANIRSTLEHVLTLAELNKARQALHLVGFSQLGDGDYNSISEMENDARALGYPAIK